MSQQGQFVKYWITHAKALPSSNKEVANYGLSFLLEPNPQRQPKI